MNTTWAMATAMASSMAIPSDGAQLKYQNDKFAATAGYGKFKESVMAGDEGHDGVKTGYGELDGFFGGGRMAGSADGVYYNDYTVSGGTQNAKPGAERLGDGFRFDDSWGAYASVNFGKWNALANYEKYNSSNDKASNNEGARPEVTRLQADLRCLEFRYRKSGCLI